MEAYEYTSLDVTGKQQKGIIQADNEKQARQQLRNRDLGPIEGSQGIVRQATIQRLNSKPTLKNVDVEAIKEEFAKAVQKPAAK